MAESYIGFAVLIAMLIALNVHSSDAATTKKKCFEGYATGMNMKKTMMNVTEKDCPADTKYCSKWYMLKENNASHGYYFGYSCGKTTKADSKCTSDYPDMAQEASWMSPCAGAANTRPAHCPTFTGANKTALVWTCNCGGDLCNFSTNNQPIGIWRMIIGVLGVFLTLTVTY